MTALITSMADPSSLSSLEPAQKRDNRPRQ